MEDLDTEKKLHEQMYEVIRANAAVNEEILIITRKIQRYIVWLRVMNIIKLIFVVVPILFGFWFLSSSYFDQLTSGLNVYTELLGVDQNKEEKSPQTSEEQDIIQQIEQLKHSDQLDYLLN